MQPRLFLLSLLLLPLGLTSCLGPPQGEEIYPYGPPRYGHGGTQSPPPAGPAGPPPSGPQGGGQGYEWQNQGNNTGNASTSGGQTPPAYDPAPGPNVPDPSPEVTQTGPPPSSQGGANTGGTPSKPPADTGSAETPYGIPVPGKDGMLYSPYKPDAGFIDITTRSADGTTGTLPPGTKIKDPFSGKAILVP